MLKEYFEVLNHWRRIRSDKVEKESLLIMSCLLSNMSYRLPEESKVDRLIGFKVIYRTLLGVFNRKVRSYERISDGDVAILEGTFNFIELECEYVEKQSADKIGYYINKNTILSSDESSVKKIILSLVVIFYSLKTALGCLIKKENRVNKSLTIIEFLEIASLLKILKINKIKKIYDFIPYEKDGNFISYVLKKNGIKVIKLPSPGPLSTHNDVLLGDELILSSEYQFEELNHLPNVKADKVKKWLPEFGFTYIYKYLSGSSAKSSFFLGYYSHGSWLRKEQGHARDGLNLEDLENKILIDIQKYLKNNPRRKLKIFLHPKERGEIEKATKFYKSIFLETKFEISLPNEKTSMFFDNIEIAITPFSTIVYERLFCGFKTLIGNYEMKNFPLKDSPLNNICFNNYEKLEQLISSFEETNRDTFFSQNRLNNYKYTEYPYFKEKYDYHN